ncbi:hypothetical protein PPGU19_086630 (plasmid) [Paraburkholderia sp. PGU19]|nr:hypothetical protein PPGU19_086630 [Paraburkholderia sp. PGU19]
MRRLALVRKTELEFKEPSYRQLSNGLGECGPDTNAAMLRHDPDFKHLNFNRWTLSGGGVLDTDYEGAVAHR